VTIDRATIATPDLDAALAFYAKAFDWSGVVPETQTLRCGGQESKLRRVQAQAGKLLLELIEPRPGAGDPYALHLERRDHGLVHAGGEVVSSDMSETPTIEGQWLESGESFGLFDWSGGAGTLQLRAASA
jgi:catechol 2,3-dioxygenase-like lactoylglutathione lyase family enzyme